MRISSINFCSVTTIHYVIFEKLALNIIRKILFTAFRFYGKFLFIQVIHSKGFVKVGESSIFIKVHTSHREDAFKICNFVLESIKKNVPIWKKEYESNLIQWLVSSNKMQ